MKSLVILFFLASISINCGESIVQSRTVGEVERGALSSPTPEESCLVEDYKPKSNSELPAMSPRELIDELIKNNPNSFDSYSAMADYEDLIEELVRKAGVKSLPVISEYLDSYDHKNRSECSELRFAIVARLASDIDRFDFRIRGTKEGKVVIDSLERALQR